MAACASFAVVIVDIFIGSSGNGGADVDEFVTWLSYQLSVGVVVTVNE